jgi:hypothetical protein
MLQLLLHQDWILAGHGPWRSWQLVARTLTDSGNIATCAALEIHLLIEGCRVARTVWWSACSQPVHSALCLLVKQQHWQQQASSQSHLIPHSHLSAASHLKYCMEL